MARPSDTPACVDFLDAQCEDFQRMHGLGRRQRECLLRDDLDGLSEAMAQMQVLMVRVRLRQRDFGGGMTDELRRQPEVAARVDRLRLLIESIAQTRAQSEDAARRLMHQTRSQMKQVSLRHRVRQGYNRASRISGPRFTDGLR